MYPASGITNVTSSAVPQTPNMFPFAYPQSQLGAGFPPLPNSFYGGYSLSSQPLQVNPMASSQPNMQPTSSASTSSSAQADPVVSTQPINTATAPSGSFQGNPYPYSFTSPFMQSTNTASSFPIFPGNPLVNVQQISSPAASAASTYTTNYYTLIEKQKVFQHLIESLKSNVNCDAVEAEVKYNHLYALYESYANTEADISSYLRGTNFTNRMKKAEQFQREVIALQVSLKKIMKNSTSPPVFKVEDKKSDSNVASSSSTSNTNLSAEKTKTKDSVSVIKTEKVNGPKSDSDAKPTATGTSKTDAEVSSKQKLDELLGGFLSDLSIEKKELLKNMLDQAGKSQIDSAKLGDKTNVSEVPQANESADKTEVSTPDEFEVILKPNETDDQVNLTKQPEEKDAVIKKIDVAEFLNSLIRTGHFSNKNELEKKD